MRPPRKIERVLAALLERSRNSRELEAPPIFDHVGHSTAADLRRLGIEIVATPEVLRGYAGQPCRVARYSIPPEGRARAIEILEVMRARRARGGA